MRKCGRLFSSSAGTAAAGSWTAAVGLEVHAQISSGIKIFSNGAVSRSRDDLDPPPNSSCTLFDVAIPGTLPVISESCVTAGIQTALALSSRINMCSYFDRKHYFYPDLPAGYQITQNRVPLAVGGYLSVPSRSTASPLVVQLKQIQLEQDSGRIVYEEIKRDDRERRCLVDYNRAGVGLMEIVTEPVMSCGSEAEEFMHELRLLLTTLGTCDCNKHDGSLRIDANVSVRPNDSNQLGAKTEIKNINGLKFLSKAIDSEIARQIKILSTGGEVAKETRSLDEKTGVTIATRGKSQYEDYRFMAEHDLPPLILYSNQTPPPDGVTPAINIDDVAASLLELPSQWRERLVSNYGLNLDQVKVLESEDWAIEYFEEVTKIVSTVPVRLIYYWITSELYGTESAVTPAQLSSILTLLHEETIKRPLAKNILRRMVNGDTRTAELILNELDIKSLDETELTEVCCSVLDQFPKQVEQYHEGRTRKITDFLMGEVMKRTKRGSDPGTVRAVLLQELAKRNGLS